MRRTTTRSPSGRNFIGILFRKFLKLLDYRQVAALATGECQRRARYLGRPGSPVKPPPPGIGPKIWVSPETPMNRWSVSRPFRGILALECNRLPNLAVVHVWFSRASPRWLSGLRGCQRGKLVNEQRRPV